MVCGEVVELNLKGKILGHATHGRREAPIRNQSQQWWCVYVFQVSGWYDWTIEAHGRHVTVANDENCQVLVLGNCQLLNMQFCRNDGGA